MAKTSLESRREAAQRAHAITASQGGCYAGSPWKGTYDKPVPRTAKAGPTARKNPRDARYYR